MMIEMINPGFPSIHTWVDESRKKEYLAAGYKPAAEVSDDLHDSGHSTKRVSRAKRK